MSSALNIAIYKRLTGIEVLTDDYLGFQQAVAAKLAPDPNKGNRPSVRFGNISDESLYPCITFRPAKGKIDERFTRASIGVDHPIYDFEIWGKTRLANEVTDISDLVDKLIEQRWGCPLMPLSVGRLHRAVALTTLALIYDSKRNAWCGLTRYHFIERRL